ncbi:Vacuolar calcium ion transporter 2 [Colletotrichum musicola]|uniref:Tryptophan synthase n=1 Tax=Colletotrichum musicola TaxID=2175873 RepID=A0A8H6JL63_9PEZI|nr:Vacuolar calcium ion transporter 2 [Colletotrichum musicola]
MSGSAALLGIYDPSKPSYERTAMASDGNCVLSTKRFGNYGGQYVFEGLMEYLTALESAFLQHTATQDFWGEYFAHNDFTGCANRILLAERLTGRVGGAKIWLIRDDLMHTGSYKINNVLGQVLLARRMGRRTIITATGAGQHGVAAAAICARFGMECTVYMGAADMARQSINVKKIQLYGARVVSVHTGAMTLREAMSQAFTSVAGCQDSAFYLAGTPTGPHPLPVIVQTFLSAVSVSAKDAFRGLAGKLPDVVVACVGTGANALATFESFTNESTVKLVGVEAAGLGIDTGHHSATLTKGTKGVFNGAMSYVLQDAFGQIQTSHSIAAGLDYPGVSPRLSDLKDRQGIKLAYATDQEAIESFLMTAELEGILPALEGAHAIHIATKLARAMGTGDILSDVLTTMLSVQQLPAELLDQISRFIPSSFDISRLALTCVRLHVVANPVLYRRALESRTVLTWAVNRDRPDVIERALSYQDRSACRKDTYELNIHLHQALICGSFRAANALLDVGAGVVYCRDSACRSSCARTRRWLLDNTSCMLGSLALAARRRYCATVQDNRHCPYTSEREFWGWKRRAMVKITGQLRGLTGRFGPASGELQHELDLALIAAVAADAHSPEVMAYLVGIGADVNAVVNSCITGQAWFGALDEEVAELFTDKVRFLLAHGVDAARVFSGDGCQTPIEFLLTKVFRNCFYKMDTSWIPGALHQMDILEDLGCLTWPSVTLCYEHRDDRVPTSIRPVHDAEPGAHEIQRIFASKSGLVKPLQEALCLHALFRPFARQAQGNRATEAPMPALRRRGLARRPDFVWRTSTYGLDRISFPAHMHASLKNTFGRDIIVTSRDINTMLRLSSSPRVVESALPGGMMSPAPPVPRCVAYDTGRLNHMLAVFLLVVLLLAASTETFSRSPTAFLVLNMLAIIPLSAVHAFGTRQVSTKLDAASGGLLQVTSGNAFKLIFGIVALRENQVEVAQSSILGSVLFDVLVATGSCFFFGGIFNMRDGNASGGTQQVFASGTAQTTCSIMALSSASLFIPVTLYSVLDATESPQKDRAILMLSRGTAVVLLLLYVLYLWFRLRTHSSLFDDEADRRHDEAGEPVLGPVAAAVALAVTTALFAVCAARVVASIDSFAESARVSRGFVALVCVPVVGNAAGYLDAVSLAIRNRMDLAMSAATGSGVQVALFVAPSLVVLAWAVLDKPLTLRFETLCTVAFVVSLMLVARTVQDGRSNYLEGAMLVGLHLIIALAVDGVPGEDPGDTWLTEQRHPLQVEATVIPGSAVKRPKPTGLILPWRANVVHGVVETSGIKPNRLRGEGSVLSRRPGGTYVGKVNTLTINTSYPSHHTCQPDMAGPPICTATKRRGAYDTTGVAKPLPPPKPR